ncbi:MAG TPA: hypothetical protein VLJ15_08575, partial [Gammaproteobacteria bacterium]|nr:hypothetical protein [Gammaproteobacteria bacterium]
MMVRFLAELDKLDFDTLDALAVDAKKFPVLKDKEQTIALGTDTETVRLQPQDLPVFDALNAIPSPPAELADRRKMRGDLIQECSQYEPDKIATWLAKIERLESLTKSITLQNEPLAMVKVALQ